MFRVGECQLNGAISATLVEIVLEGAIEPSVLRGLEAPSVDHTKGVVLSGRGPIWLYGALVHHYHPTPWVGVYDPRVGVVVVASHTRALEVGDVLQLSQ